MLKKIDLPVRSFIKYTGSKKYLVNQIKDLLPSDIDTYYEPFLGTGIILTTAVEKCNKIVGSDLSPYLMGLWKYVKEDPDIILHHYSSYWPADSDKYYVMRDKFNELYNPLDFYCLLRTSINGLVRFNNKTNKFNASYHHHGREGMHPDKVKILLYQWHEFIKEYDIQLEEKSFEWVLDVVTDRDFVFLDPPYKNAGGMYGNAVSYEKLEYVLMELNKRGTKWLMTFDGMFKHVDTSYSFDSSLYKTHGFFKTATSKWRVEKGNKVQESYYINY